MIKIALIQFPVSSGETATNEKIVAEQIKTAAGYGVDFVVLPELWNCGYDLVNLPSLAQTFQGSSITLLKRLAREYQVFIFGGSIAEKRDGNFYNTAVAIDQKGFLVGKYRKSHLFSLEIEENKYFTPGEEWGLVKTPWGLAGIILCYDLRFPELMRNLVLRGAKFVIVSAQWPAFREDHWYTLCKARAIENQVFVLAVNRTGGDETIRYPGRSLIVSPWGEVLSEAGDEPVIVRADIDLSQVDQVRALLPVFSDRRGILDEIDNGQI